MRTLAEMDEEEFQTYLQLLADATKSVMPPDGHFVVVVFGPDQRAGYVANMRRLGAPEALEEVARNMRDSIAKNN